MAFQLGDVARADAGSACVPGGHGANCPCPDEIRLYHQHQDRFVRVPASAGDAILFVDSLMHGVLPWSGANQRRTAIARHLPGVMAEVIWGSYTSSPFFDEPSAAQQAVISAPHYCRVDRGPSSIRTD